jgi:hypothetical protein
VYAPDYPENIRNWHVSNNVYGWSPKVKEFWAARSDTVKPPAFIGAWGMDHYFGGHKPNFVAENNVEEYIEFTDAPPVDDILAFVKYRFDSNFSDENNPDFRADRNGIGSIELDPGSFGPEENPYSFAYPVTQPAYTGGQYGFPVGDLNWFPDKKAEWETFMTGVETTEVPVVTDYLLEQNYPNPFNPTTRIHYTLPANATVSLTIYNALGQRVATLLDESRQTAGAHSVEWTAVTTNGASAPSGVYYYQLQTENVNVTKKMMLLK